MCCLVTISDLRILITTLVSSNSLSMQAILEIYIYIYNITEY
jgi:hypothetical protein